MCLQEHMLDIPKHNTLDSKMSNLTQTMHGRKPDIYIYIYTVANTPCRSMDVELVKQLELIRDDQVLAVNTKAAKIITVLAGKGLVYDQVVPPALMLVHCQNRAGKMVNSFDVHEKGYQALKVGWSLEKLGQSYCFELPQSLEDRDRQVKAMKLLVDSSEGRLAPLTGAERFVSVSSSHMSQFCRSVGAGCQN